MSIPRTLQEKVIKGSIITLALSFLGSVFAYLIRILYSRTLSIEEYGLFYAVFGFFSIISIYTDLGFGEAISYFVPKYLKLKKMDHLWITFVYGQLIQVFVALLITGILIISAPILSSKYFKVADSVSVIYIFCAFLVINSVLNSLSQIFTGFQRPKYFSALGVLKYAFVLFFSYSFLLVGFHGPIFYSYAWVFGYLVTMIVFQYLLWKKYLFSKSYNLSWQKDLFIKMGKYAMPAFATTLVYSLLVSSDIFFLTSMKGVKEVGIYNIVAPIASIPLILFSPINSLIFPLASHLYEGEKEKLITLISKIYKIIPYIGVYFALFIVLFPSSIVELIFGQQWLGLTQLPLSIMAVGHIAYLLSIILSIILLGMGKVSDRLKIFMLMTILGIGLHALLIYKYGVLGAVITNSLIAILLCIIFTLIIKSIVNFSIPAWFYTKLLIFSIIVFILVRITGFTPSNWLELVFSGLIYSLLFIIFGFLHKVYDKEVLKIILY